MTHFDTPLLSAHSVTSVDCIHQGDALTLLRALPSNYINCLVTSPPYFGLRDYNVAGQIGLEATPQEFVRRLVDVFREVKRVLRDDGVIWVNMGDSYSRQAGDDSTKETDSGLGRTGRTGKSELLFKSGNNRPPEGIPPKNLLGMPWRVAFGLQDDGWILRSDIIWHKNNPMPESVSDRPTKSHEYVFLLAKRERYWYDADAIREKVGEPTRRGSYFRDQGYTNNRSFDNSGSRETDEVYHELDTSLVGRNKRTVWTIATEPTPFAHFATFPQKLIEPMILAGCPHKVCAVCGAPWVRQVEVSGGTIGKGGWHDHSDDLGKGMQSVRGNGIDRSTADYRRETIGFAPTCDHNAATRPGIVIDPFFGSGTTGLVARRLGRHYVGIELNPEYVKLAEGRLAVPYTLPMTELLTARQNTTPPVRQALAAAGEGQE